MEKQEFILLRIPHVARRCGPVTSSLIPRFSDRVRIKHTKLVVKIQRNAISTSSCQMFLWEGVHVGDHLECECWDCRDPARNCNSQILSKSGRMIKMFV